MGKMSRIITVGLSPAWDITCQGRELGWGRHEVISSASSVPAGKALNISKALAWLGTKTIAAGLWGRDDYEQMLEAISPLRRLITIKMTSVAGATRQNITVVDTANNREMHLRAVSGLASQKTLTKLRTDLKKIVTRNGVCVFAGAMPLKELLSDVITIVNFCRSKGAKIAVDTSGAALKRIVDSGNVWLVKPNVNELSELLDEQIKDTTSSLARAGRELLDKKSVDFVLISRSRKGAIVVTKKATWQGRHIGSHKTVLSTVGCGDFLLAGFLKSLRDKADVGSALETAIKVATARAWGWTEKRQWTQVRRQIKVQVEKIWAKP